jgi:ABC-2 type transport system ATP-binding protein
MLQGGGIQMAIRPIEVLTQYAAFFADPEPPEELLERVGLAERRKSSYRSLSGGEKQRLSLALALVGKPELLFLDEPTAGVDLAGRDLIRTLIRDLSDSNRTVVLTTHDIAEAEQLGDQIVILHRGKVVASGTPAELTSSEGDNLGFSAQPGLAVSEMSAHLGAPVSETAPGTYVVEAAPEPQLVSAVANWLASHSQSVGDIRARTRSLEDVFREVTGEA